MNQSVYVPWGTASPCDSLGSPSGTVATWGHFRAWVATPEATSVYNLCKQSNVTAQVTESSICSVATVSLKGPDGFQFFPHGTQSPRWLASELLSMA